MTLGSGIKKILKKKNVFLVFYFGITKAQFHICVHFIYVTCGEQLLNEARKQYYDHNKEQ